MNLRAILLRGVTVVILALFYGFMFGIIGGVGGFFIAARRAQDDGAKSDEAYRLK
ncbi:MAG TPA: hypothetical protein VGR30_10920 [Candidatus Binatia bacterium]|jgi:predicted ABC-type sugar transport system permease subunit|nr:hypothetical protein [Candidatus Binatia bacterium]